MSKNLQLGQKLTMSLDDLIKHAQKSKKSNSKAEEGRSVKGTRGKLVRKASGSGNAKGINPSNKVAQNSGVSKKTATKKTLKKSAPLRTGKSTALRKPQTRQAKNHQAPQGAQALSNKDLLAQVRMNLNSKKDSQGAMRLAKQLQAEAQKLLGVSAGGGPRQQNVPRARAASRPERADRQPRSDNAPYCVAEPQYYEPQSQNFLQDDQRVSDGDLMDVEEEAHDIKPNIHALRVQASSFARGVRGQARR